MIPRSITLRGFLCYKDEQVIDFDGFDLWVLAGRNGSGKSAIFDAVTFALFKAHRGGKQEAANLIHTEAAELSVCFEFDLGAERYRVKRTVPRRGAADRGVYRFAPQPDGSERWPAVPETQTEKGLERWVRENIGLTYETFTASVLLLQGGSESLLGAKPTARFEIIAGIVDLESYRDLHKRAEAGRQHGKGKAESLRNQLRAMPVIEPEAIEQAESQSAEAEAARAAIEAEWKRLVGLGAQSATWLDLVGRREKASAKREHARQLIADSVAIARDWARFQDLEGALSSVRQSMTRREAITRFVAESRCGDDERRALSRKLDLIASLAEDNRRHLETIVAEIGRDEARDRAILERQAALAIPIHRASQARTKGEEVRRLEGVLASYPTDLAARVADLEEGHRLRAGWRAALPSLATLARERDRLAEARGRRIAAQRALEAGTVQASQAEAALAGRRTEEAAARLAESQARDRATEAATIARAAENRLAQFEGLGGLTTCDRCGQELTPDHFASEEVRLHDERDLATESAESADGAHREARSRLDDAESARAEADRSLRAAEEAVSAASHDLVQAGRDADHNARACLGAYECLDDPFRLRVAGEQPDDWVSAAFPGAGDLDEGQRLVAEAEEVQSRLNAERARLNEMESDRIRLEQASRTLAAVGLEPGDEAAETEQAALQAEREWLVRCLKGHATEKALAEQNQAKLDEHDRGLRARLTGAEGKLATARARLEALRDEAARARAAAPESWRDAFDTATEADIAVWEDERQSLRAKGLDALAAELPQAHLLLGQAEADLEDMERRIDALPWEARRDPDAIDASISKADRDLALAEEERRTRQGILDKLRSDRDTRLDVGSRTLAAERDLAVAETLAGLLGPRGLQRDLIREAERGIVAFANPILREVSGGELELRLLDVVEDEPDLALQLEAIERVHGRTGTRGVEYLSGSQKFRVAVSLALAIGQYARGSKERPIESVIIDEGFGSLDRQGRDEMIEQLNALRGRLARIILVSHQEEFSEAFRDGYHLEVVEGSTMARPFHR
jgi:exonuclease SbcC